MSAPHPIAPQKGHLHGLSSSRAINEHSVVDISTHGPKSGATRRIEIRLWHADGRIFLSGRPGKRSWYANLRANPSADRAREERRRGRRGDDSAADHRHGERREMLSRIASPNELDAWIEGSPLVELTEV
jgi:F420H(2)-dependent quinone reductase